MEKQYFNTIGKVGGNMQTLAVSKEVATKILAQAERRASSACRISPVKCGKSISATIKTVVAPEVFEGGVLAGWLIGFRHIGVGGVLSIKPERGFAEIVCSNGELGVIPHKMVDNWAELPVNIYP